MVFFPWPMTEVEEVLTPRRKADGNGGKILIRNRNSLLSARWLWTLWTFAVNVCYLWNSALRVYQSAYFQSELDFHIIINPKWLANMLSKSMAPVPWKRDPLSRRSRKDLSRKGKSGQNRRTIFTFRHVMVLEAWRLSSSGLGWHPPPLLENVPLEISPCRCHALVAFSTEVLLNIGTCSPWIVQIQARDRCPCQLSSGYLFQKSQDRSN